MFIPTNEKSKEDPLAKRLCLRGAANEGCPKS
jgi:hypothetical protein